MRKMRKKCLIWRKRERKRMREEPPFLSPRRNAKERLKRMARLRNQMTRKTKSVKKAVTKVQDHSLI